MINKNAKVYVAGHSGMVGSAVLRKLINSGFKKIIYRDFNHLDLRDQAAVNNFFKIEKPDFVIDAAAKVGGINANKENPYEFLIDNMRIQNNIIQFSNEYNVKKLLFLGSSCIYPKFSKQPIKEEYLLKGSLEETNEAYALAKISGLKLCEYISKNFNKRFISLMPTNLYGQNDNFHKDSSHVIPGMLMKFHNAKLKNQKYVELWGTGNPLREFLHVDDLAEAIYLVLHSDFDDNVLNVGSGNEVSIKELSTIIKKITSFNGDIVWNSKMPDGTPRKILDSSRINKIGFSPKINLYDGLEQTYDWFVKNYKKIRLIKM